MAALAWRGRQVWSPLCQLLHGCSAPTPSLRTGLGAARPEQRGRSRGFLICGSNAAGQHSAERGYPFQPATYVRCDGCALWANAFGLHRCPGGAPTPCLRIGRWGRPAAPPGPGSAVVIPVRRALDRAAAHGAGHAERARRALAAARGLQPSQKTGQLGSYCGA